MVSKNAWCILCANHSGTCSIVQLMYVSENVVKCTDWNYSKTWWPELSPRETEQESLGLRSCLKAKQMNKQSLAVSAWFSNHSRKERIEPPGSWYLVVYRTSRILLSLGLNLKSVLIKFLQDSLTMYQVSFGPLFVCKPLKTTLDVEMDSYNPSALKYLESR